MAARGSRADDEHAFIRPDDAIDPLYGLVEVNRERISVGGAAIVAERFEARRLVVRRHERQATDLQQLRRREEHHVSREVQDGIDERALLEDDITEVMLPGGNGRCQSCRPRSHDDDVQR